VKSLIDRDFVKLQHCPPFLHFTVHQHHTHLLFRAVSN
jgi:hypothetical protein